MLCVDWREWCCAVVVCAPLILCDDAFLDPDLTCKASLTSLAQHHMQASLAMGAALSCTYCMCACMCGKQLAILLHASHRATMARCLCRTSQGFWLVPNLAATECEEKPISKARMTDAAVKDPSWQVEFTSTKLGLLDMLRQIQIRSG